MPTSDGETEPTEADVAGTGEQFPLTTESLSEGELGVQDIVDQIKYAVYNRNRRLSEIAEVVTFSGDWTREMVDDLVDEGVLVEGSDPTGPFYRLNEDERHSLSDAEYEALHESARKEYGGTPSTSAEDSTVAPPHARAESVMSDTDDTVEGPEADPEDVERARAKHGGRLPVDRGYDWSAERLDPDRAEEYVSANGEKEDILKEIRDLHETGKMPHFSIRGPTGCGKTSLGEDISIDLDAVAFVINCHDGLRPNNLLGMPTYVGDETWWVDGPITKAIIASELANRDDTDFDEVVVIFDEINRTTSRTLGVIMSALDHQCSVTLNARGGETVRGDPENLIVFSTMNQGREYQVNKLDPAQVRRLGNTFYTDYIGLHDLTRECLLIESRTPLGDDIDLESMDDEERETFIEEYDPNPVVRAMVTAANDIRRKAKKDGPIDLGVPTGTMLEWARTAWSYRDDDHELGPVFKAAQRSVINPFYRSDESAEDVATETISDHVGGMSVDEDPLDLSGAGDTDREDVDLGDISDETWLICEECGWYEQAAKADEEVVVSMDCPDCGGLLEPREGPS